MQKNLTFIATKLYLCRRKSWGKDFFLVFIKNKKINSMIQVNTYQISAAPSADYPYGMADYGTGIGVFNQNDDIG